jgi:hypothetical protein
MAISAYKTGKYNDRWAQRAWSNNGAKKTMIEI